jgi:hypothetical protein
VRSRRARIVLTAAALAVPAALLAYGTAIHDLLPPTVLAGQPALGVAVGRDTLPGVGDRDLERFRQWLYGRVRHQSDTALRRRFLTRYPTPASFDARAFREFLMLNGEARVLGVDSFAAVRRAMRPVDRAADPHPPYRPGARIALTEALSIGSIYPDLDRRNQARLWRDGTGAVVRTARGDSVPFDPASLNMGARTGLSSQAHAHYGLNRNPKSADPAVLKTAPWDFAIATGFDGPVETWAADNAQICSDLAVLAARWDPRAGRTLSAFWAGGAMHYIADVGNAVHTVQVGIYEIFVDATIQSWLRRASTLFGLLSTPRTRNAIGLDILTNLHTLSEHLYQAELLALRTLPDTAQARPTMRGAVRALASGDDSLATALADTLRAIATGAAPAFGRVIAWKVTDANMRDGAEVYRVTREIAARRLRSGRIAVDFDTVPDARLWSFVRVRPDASEATALDTFNAVHHRGLARTTSALRAWWREYARLAAPARPAATDTLIARFVTERLAYLDAADVRRRAWIASHGGTRTP